MSKTRNSFIFTHFQTWEWIMFLSLYGLVLYFKAESCCENNRAIEFGVFHVEKMEEGTTRINQGI